jgi:hypothetical protein
MGSNDNTAFQRPKLSLSAETDLGGAKSLGDLVDFNAEFNPSHIFCKQAEVTGREENESIYSSKPNYSY